MASSLGHFIFSEFNFPTEIVQQDIEVLRYAATDGEDFRFHGFHGRPFQTTTKVDVLTYGLGMTLLEEYRDAVTDVPYQLVHEGYDWDVGNWRFKIMRVQPGGNDAPGIKQAICIAGGFHSLSQFIVTATWTLLPVIYP